MKLFLIIMFLFAGGCNATYRPSIIDIRDEPYPIDWSPRQPDKLAHLIMEFKP